MSVPGGRECVGSYACNATPAVCMTAARVVIWLLPADVTRVRCFPSSRRLRDFLERHIDRHEAQSQSNEDLVFVVLEDRSRGFGETGKQASRSR